MITSTRDEAARRRPAGLQAAWEHAEQMVTIYHGRADMAHLYYLVALVTLASWRIGAGAGSDDWRRWLPVLAFAALAETGYRQVLRLHESGLRWARIAQGHWDRFAALTGLGQELDEYREQRRITGSGSRRNAGAMRLMGLGLTWVKLLDVSSDPPALLAGALATTIAVALWWRLDRPRLDPNRPSQPAQIRSESTGQAPESTP